MQCLFYLGSSVFNIYYEKSRDGSPLNKIMRRCLDMDKTLSEKIVTVPKGTDFNIEEGLECYQNDEESKGVRNVGHLPEELCGIIWNITRHDINRKRLREQPPVIKGDQHPQDPELITKKAYYHH